MQTLINALKTRELTKVDFRRLLGPTKPEVFYMEWIKTSGRALNDMYLDNFDPSYQDPDTGNTCAMVWVIHVKTPVPSNLNHDPCIINNNGDTVMSLWHQHIGEYDDSIFWESKDFVRNREFFWKIVFNKSDEESFIKLALLTDIHKNVEITKTTHELINPCFDLPVNINKTIYYITGHKIKDLVKFKLELKDTIYVVPDVKGLNKFITNQYSIDWIRHIKCAPPSGIIGKDATVGDPNYNRIPAMWWFIRGISQYVPDSLLPECFMDAQDKDGFTTAHHYVVKYGETPKQSYFLHDSDMQTFSGHTAKDLFHIHHPDKDLPEKGNRWLLSDDVVRRLQCSVTRMYIGTVSDCMELYCLSGVCDHPISEMAAKESYSRHNACPICRRRQ